MVPTRSYPCEVSTVGSFVSDNVEFKLYPVGIVLSSGNAGGGPQNSGFIPLETVSTLSYGLQVVSYPPAGEENADYYYVPLAASGNSSPVTWSVNGSLPTWISLINVNGGNIISFVGNNTNSNTGDGDDFTAATTGESWGIDFDGAGNLYFLNGTTSIRKVDISTGVISTVAGTGTAGFTGDGGPATSADTHMFYFTVDHFGNIYIGDNSFRDSKSRCFDRNHYYDCRQWHDWVLR